MSHTNQTQKETIPIEINLVARKIVDAAITVHKALGPGLSESVYEACLVYELNERQLKTRRQVPIPIIYDGIKLDSELRLDLLVDEAVVIELKAIEQVLPVHRSQLLSYLKLSGYRLGLLINFDVPLVKDGITRIAC